MIIRRRLKETFPWYRLYCRQPTNNAQMPALISRHWSHRRFRIYTQKRELEDHAFAYSTHCLSLGIVPLPLDVRYAMMRPRQSFDILTRQRRRLTRILVAWIYSPHAEQHISLIISLQALIWCQSLLFLWFPRRAYYLRPFDITLTLSELLDIIASDIAHGISHAALQCLWRKDKFLAIYEFYRHYCWLRRFPRKYATIHWRGNLMILFMACATSKYLLDGTLPSLDKKTIIRLSFYNANSYVLWFITYRHIPCALN